jgi:hypothetical protein
MIEEKNFSLKRAAEELDIKLATAKSIFRSFKKNGKIMEKK